MIQKWQVGYVFIIMNLGTAFYLYDKLIYSSTNRGHWEVILCQGLLQLFLIWLYIKGLKKFPKKDIIDIYLKIGRWLGIVMIVPLIVHLVIEVLLNIRANSEIIVFAFLPRTPNWAVMLLLFFVSTYTSIKGLQTILRSSIFLFFIIIPNLIFIMSLSIVNLDIQNAFPFWNTSVDFLFNGHFPYIVGSSTFLFLGVITPKVELDFSKIAIAWAFLMLILLGIIYIPLLTFGQEMAVTLFLPFVDAINSIEISWFPISRGTMFLGLTLISFVIVYNALILWMIGEMSRKLTKCHKRIVPYIILGLSIIGFILASFIPNWDWIEKWLKWNLIMQCFAMKIIPTTVFFISLLYKKDVMTYK